MQWPKRTGLSVIIQSPSRIYPFSSALKVSLISVRYFSAYSVRYFIRTFDADPLSYGFITAEYKNGLLVVVSKDNCRTRFDRPLPYCGSRCNHRPEKEEEKASRHHSAGKLVSVSIASFLRRTYLSDITNDNRCQRLWSCARQLCLKSGRFDRTHAPKRSAFHFSSFSLSCCILFCFYCISIAPLRMSSTTLDHSHLAAQLSRYESVFKHYDFHRDTARTRYERPATMSDDLHSFVDRQNRATERNESNQKSITAKSVKKKTKGSPTRSSKAKKSNKQVHCFYLDRYSSYWMSTLGEQKRTGKSHQNTPSRHGQIS